MQARHNNRSQYFCESANTAREFYVEYLRPHLPLGPGTRVLEIGCGEGGNLLPFAELGCEVAGIDLCQGRIREARQFFAQHHQRGTFLCQDFMQAEPPESEAGRYDLVLLHDVIEHIEPPCKQQFLAHIQPFLKQGGVVFVAFPAWQNPFGGHQQIVPGFASRLPFIHLLPPALYRGLLRCSGASAQHVAELMSIRRSRMPVERFEALAVAAGYRLLQRTLWLVNPHYKQKFRLQPRRQWALFSRLPYVRNFYTTSAFYLLCL